MSCVSVCTDGAAAMVGRIKGFLSRVREKNPNVVVTHCFVHREALVAKTLPTELASVLDNVVSMVQTCKLLRGKKVTVSRGDFFFYCKIQMTLV